MVIKRTKHPLNRSNFEYGSIAFQNIKNFEQTPLELEVVVDTAQSNFRKIRIWTEFYPRPSKDLNHKMQSKVLSEKKIVSKVPPRLSHLRTSPLNPIILMIFLMQKNRILIFSIFLEKSSFKVGKSGVF